MSKDRKPREWYVIEDGPQEVMWPTKPPGEKCFKVREVIEDDPKERKE